MGDLVRDNKGQIAELLENAATITPIVLKNKESVISSLEWLPAVGEGLRNAYHGGEIKATDVRSDRPTAGLCEDFDDLFPIDDLPPALQDVFEEILNQLESEFCPSPDSGGGGGGASVPTSPDIPDAPGAPRTPGDLVPDLQQECKKAIKTIKKQIDRIEEIGVSEELKAEIISPLEKRVKRLKKNCEQLGGAIEDPSNLEDILEELPDDIRELLPDDVEGSTPDLDNLTGNAAGTAVGGEPSPSVGDQVRSWFGGFMDFVGVSS
jgi:hypothetical protein